MVQRGKTFTKEQWKEIQSVFDDIVDLHPDQRAQCLAERTRDSPVVREHVQSLLLFDVGDSLPAKSVPSSDQPAALQQAGNQINAKYRLLYPLAISVASEVWCAESLESNQNGTPVRVAVKLLRNQKGRMLERFRNEALILSQFRHPNIAEFLDCGRLPKGTPYIVTKFVVGKPVTEFADEQQLTVKERAELMMRICEAVNYAHRFLVVHRDLKPSNILVTRDAQPVILDFGISKVLDDSVEGSSKSVIVNPMTTGVERPMTPAYASPEQLHGEPITTATDVHALGLILYELVCGHHPFSPAAHPFTNNLFDRVSVSVSRLPSEMVTLPSLPLGTDPGDGVHSAPVLLAALRGVSPRQLRRQLRQGIDNVTLMAMAKSPDERYRSVADLRNDLENIVAGRPVAARVDRDIVRSAIRRNPVRWLALSSAAAGLLTLLLLGSWWGIRSQQMKRNLADVQSQASLARDLEQAARAEQENTKEVLNRLLDGAPTSMELTSFAIPSDLDSSQLAKIARTAVNTGDTEFAKSLVDQLDLKAAPLLARMHAAAVWRKLGRPTEGIRALGEFLQPAFSWQRLGGSESETVVDLKCIALELLLDAGRVNEARQWNEFDFGLPNWDELDGRHALLVAELRLAIGWEEGCKEIVEALRNQPQQFALTSESLIRCKLLELLAEPSLEGVHQLWTEARFCSAETQVKVLLVRHQVETREHDEKAAEKTLSAVGKIANALPESHVLRLQTLFQSVQLSDSISEEKSLERLGKYWGMVKSTGEVGTVSAALAALRLMRHAPNQESLRDYLATMQPCRPFIDAYPYLEREFLSHEFRLRFGDADYQSASLVAKRLLELETELWPAGSMYIAFASAALADAQYHRELHEAAKATHSHCRQVIHELVDSPDSMATAFFAPLLADDSDLSVDSLGNLAGHQWVNLFIQHKENTLAMQLEMLAFYAEELENDRQLRPAKAITRSALENISRIEEIPPSAVQNVLRVCRIAATLGEYEMAAPIVTRYLQSTERSVLDAALSCQILGLHTSGDSTSAFDLAQRSLQRFEEDGERIRGAIWNISKAAPDSASWSALLD